MDDKISSEIEFLDKEISGFIDVIIGNSDKNYEVQEENAKIKTGNENGEESKSQSSEGGSEEPGKSEESSEQSAEDTENSSKSGSSSEDEITIMSMQSKQTNEIDESDWNDIETDMANLYKSWSVIESDLNTKENVEKEDIEKINKNIDNLLLYSVERNGIDFIKESVDMYNNIIKIAEQINYDNNKLYILKCKKKVYEAYTNTSENNWELAKNNIELANDYLNQIDNADDKVKILLKNLISSTEQKNEDVFFIKYMDTVNELNYML